MSGRDIFIITMLMIAAFTAVMAFTEVEPRDFPIHEFCVDGVVYFSQYNDRRSGISVKYKRDGSFELCDAGYRKGEHDLKGLR
jgi:hypothetical protein